MTDSRLQPLSWPLVMVASESLRAASKRHVPSNWKDYTLPTDAARKNRSQLPKKRPAVRSEPNASRSPANRPRAHGVHVPSRARRPIVGDMASPSPNESRPVAAQPGAIDEDLLDAEYARLAIAFNSEVADAERRTPRDTYISRREP